ncbi:AAA family ATPase [Vagococcus elongatus]|uniref:DOD-type homing endonuclease domain-containing protein n=1 Tax=Vagococcus elongatus TaxID=180344 RepID=A0A430AVY0_9ENTE|nr:AAA family ATPase [Vagococcus elongatus]RSU12213.1 hypothetical protein CBF29_06340 [Vagococcus elongatus]
MNELVDRNKTYEEIDCTAKCVAILYSKESFVIAKFERVKGEAPRTFSVKGNYLVELGKEFNIKGINAGDKNYPDSFNPIAFSQFKDLMTASSKEQEEFLGMILSKAKIKALYEVSDNPIKMLEEADIEKLMEAEGIGLATAEKLIESYENQKDFSSAYISFAKYKLSMDQVKKICKSLGGIEQAIMMVEADPFVLTQIPGYGFKRADAVFLNNPENKPNDKRRIKAYIKYLFEELHSEGHTWITAKDFVGKVKENIFNADVKWAVEHVKTNVNYVVYRLDKELRITSSKALATELAVCDEINRLLNSENKNLKRLIDSAKVIKHVQKAQGWKFSEEQQKSIKMMIAKNVFLLQGYGGTGKAQDVDIIIPTPGGMRRFGDLKPGDYIFDRHGRPTMVTQIFPQGLKKNYKITLSDGRTTTSNDEHLWSTYTSKGNLKTRTLREIIDSGLYNYSNGERNCKFKIPTNKAVEFRERDLSVDPYVLGAFLGDGSCTSKALTLSSNDEDVVAEVSKLIGCNDYRRNSTKNYNWHFYFDKPKSVLREDSFGHMQINTIYRYQTEELFSKYPEILRTSIHKSIPIEYKMGSIDQRYALIQGLFDTDGSISKAEGRYNVRYSTNSRQLAYDVQEVLLSLGIQSNVSETNRANKKNIEYNLNILTSNDKKELLFRNTHKKRTAIEALNFVKRKRYDRVSIVDIEEMEEEVEMMCIMVDNDEHLYLTNDYIVTHNTSTLNGFISIVNEAGMTYKQGALSGKAANNMFLITGKEATTLHSMLVVDPITGGFVYNKDNKMLVDVVVIDEMSMVDIFMFLDVLKATPDGAKLIMLGDMGQLESIGVGIMAGLIKTGKMPSQLLTQIHRQAQKSAIITHSIAIRNGVKPTELKFDIGSKVYGENQDLEYIFVDPKDEDQISRHVMLNFRKLIEEHDINDVQILCSTKATGKTSTWDLNKFAQRVLINKGVLDGEYITIKRKGYKKPKSDSDIKLNRDGADEDSCYFVHVGEKVINMRNNKKMYDVHGNPCPIFNGNTGTVKQIIHTDKQDILVIDFEGIGIVNVLESHFEHIELGYAITVHKSQGSTIKYVIFALPFHYLLNTRELLYTGMTRASEYLILITSPRSFKKAVKQTFVKEKRTNFSDLFTRLKDFDLSNSSNSKFKKLSD